MKESDLESILAKYPDLIEAGLILKGRQVSVYERRMDLVFEDKHKRKLIVELKAGPIKDEHIGQILSYEGMLLSADNPDIRVMLVGTRVPPNIQKTLDHHGIAWKEIKLTSLNEFLANKGDNQFDNLFEDRINLPVKMTKNETNNNSSIDNTQKGLIDLIELAGIKLRGYKFKIHCATYDNQLKIHPDPLEEFNKGKFKEWQEFQTKKNFECRYILSLIRLKDKKWKWLFAGVYEVIGDAKPSTLENIPHLQYSTQEIKGLEHLTGKTIVHFERPGRACYLRGEKYGDKLIYVGTY